MGAYLSQPVTTKETSTEENDNFWVASTSMQGWRVSQEDAHNAILNYDDYSSLFAVYDGHGGHEVAAYTAQKLPNYIKGRKDYRMGNLEKGLVEAFVEFDRTLTERDVVRELRIIAGKEVDPNEEVDHEEVDNLFQEATMPIEAVMAQNGGSGDAPPAANIKNENEDGGSSNAASVAKSDTTQASTLKSAVGNFKTRNGGSNKPISPFLRAKPQNNTSGNVKDENKEGTVPDAATTLSFKEEDDDEKKKEEIKSESTTNNGSDHKNNETPSSTEEKPAVKSNGHHKTKTEDDEVDDEVHINGEANNGVKATEEPTDIKGKGKGKGKGKSSQIIKSSKAEGETENTNTKEGSPPPPIPTPAAKSKKPPKSAAELYQNLVNDEVMDEESSEDDDEDGNAFGAGQDSDDDSDDDDDEKDDVGPIGSDDDTEEMSSDEEDTNDEDDDDDDGEEIIGGAFNEEPGNDSGCTAVVALLVGRDLFVANAGDSRCVVCRDGKAIEMSFDHKPEDDPERERITKAGGRVTPDGRVNGGLNLSRAIGDHAYKTNKMLPLTEQMISPVPDVRKLTINPETDSFIFLACDGIWNSLNSQEVVDFINARLKEQEKENTDMADTKKLTKILEQLFDHCLAPDTMGDGTGCDNMTAVIAKLKPNAFKEGTTTEDKQKVICENKVKSSNEDDDEVQNESASKRPLDDENTKAGVEPAAKKLKTDGDDSSEVASAVESIQDQAASKE